MQDLEWGVSDKFNSTPNKDISNATGSEWRTDRDTSKDILEPVIKVDTLYHG